MSITDTNMIDMVGTTFDGVVTLTISDHLDEKINEKSSMSRYLKDGILLTLVYSLAFYLMLVLFVSFYMYIYGAINQRSYIFIDLLVEYSLDFIKYLIVGAFIGFVKHNINYF